MVVAAEKWNHTVAAAVLSQGNICWRFRLLGEVG